MQHTSSNSVHFSQSKNAEFTALLRKRVSSYFSDNKISKYANSAMVIKSVIMILLYFIPYIVSLFVPQSPGIFLVLWAFMGLGMAGIGTSIMHDANHSAYSKNKTVNTILSYMLNVIGGNTVNWKIQHNSLHHTYTNVTGIDDDISRIKILRFSPFEKLLKIHKFQHVYAWFLYGLMTLSWVTKKEFVQLIDYKQKGYTKQHGNFGLLLSELLVWKLFYFSYMLIIPILVLPYSIWFILLAFFVMQFISGFTLSIVFQTAHVMPQNNYPMPDSVGLIDDSWTVHQLQTTANFAEKSRFFSWFIGGLNYQIEHHLFPQICHVHYRKISKIVEVTALEYGIPYHKESTFFSALASHAKFLKHLGKQ